MTVRFHTFADFRLHIFRLYDQGAYREGLTAIDQHREAFAEYADDLLYWEACLACRVGEPRRALQALKRAEEAGCLYGRELLMRDPDLEPIRTDPEFQALVERSSTRLEAAQKAARPELLKWEPEAADTPLPLLMALHGHGSRPDLEAPFWQPATQRGWLVAMPQSSHLMGTRRFGWQDPVRNAEEVARHYDTLKEAYPLDARRILVGGFSRGGGLAIRLALTGAVPATGFIAVAPSFRLEEALPLLEAVRQPGAVRGYFILGEQDRYSYRPSLDLADALRARGIACEVEAHPDLAHDYPPEEAGSLARALDFLTG